MPVAKSEFDQLHPCEFYAPAELFDPEKLYTVPEIGRLLQELEPDADLDAETESVLIDWTIPWIIDNADDLVVANPRSDTEPGYYGLRTDEHNDR
ncbi:MAG: DUF5827 family protein [Halobacteriales archaeon]|nr:DUF5827 family protein [Halobacteriales archaeon]